MSLQKVCNEHRLTAKQRDTLAKAHRGERTKDTKRVYGSAMEPALTDLLAEMGRPTWSKYFPLDDRGNPIPFMR